MSQPSQTPKYRSLPVQLTETERMARAMSAAESQSEYCEVEARKKDATSTLGRKLKDIRANIEKLQEAVRTSTEHQQVQIETKRNEERRTIETVRLDTGEVVDTRPMTLEERQGKLFGIPGGKAKGAANATKGAKADAKKRARAKTDAAPKGASGKPTHRRSRKAADASKTGASKATPADAPTDKTSA